MFAYKSNSFLNVNMGLLYNFFSNSPGFGVVTAPNNMASHSFALSKVLSGIALPYFLKHS